MRHRGDAYGLSTKTALCVDKIRFGVGPLRGCRTAEPLQKGRTEEPRQESLEQVKRQWGGRREGAGRKKKGEATTVGFRINPEVAEALVAEAKRLGVTRSSIVENALRAYLSLDH